MFKNRIKLNDALYLRLNENAKTQGYASTDEYATHILEQALSIGDTEGEDEEIRKRLQGLGYIG